MITLSPTVLVAGWLSQTPIDQLVRPLLPFLGILVLTVLLVAFFPAITLTVPQMIQ